MKNNNNQPTPAPWQKPEITTLSISVGTQQSGPKDPPDYESQAS
ncbi:MAG: hypothetical protein U5K72_01915 [Balneolaceae bacterium]|nr:hypothetical protein [Balneolaceae bacterium]